MDWKKPEISSSFQIISPMAGGKKETCLGYKAVKDAVSNIAEKLMSVSSSLVAISLPKSAVSVSLIFGILESGNAFVYICPSSLDFVMNESRTLNVTYLFSSFGPGDDFIIVHGHTVFITFLGHQKPLPKVRNSAVGYVIRTSGTTGTPKRISVPLSSIMPNIFDFKERFEVCSSDAILSLTALTFDPSIVEIFLAAVCGSSLVIIPDSMRSQPSILGETVCAYRNSILQLTPSLLKLLPPTTLRSILGHNSKTRILLLGGENFPTGFIQRYHTESNRTRIFNLYGITEVSCWASCREYRYGMKTVDIGQPLLQTLFKISPNNELLIGGSRQCVIDGETSGQWTPTGDLVNAGDNGDLYIVSRKDDQVKLNGVRLNLKDITCAAEKVKRVKRAATLLIRNMIILFVDVFVPNFKEELNKLLPPQWIPHRIIVIEDWPVNSHGKTDHLRLEEAFETQQRTKSMDDIGLILKQYDIDVSYDQSKTLKSLGVTSFMAAELFSHLEQMVDHSYPLFEFLLDERSTVGDLLTVLRQKSGRSLIDRGSASQSYYPVIHKNRYSLELLWGWNSGKCIDAGAVIKERRVYVGSHSGRFACINMIDGSIDWTIELPGRVEATAAVHNGVVAVGCYDFNIYFLDDLHGKEVWRFKTKDVIKSTPVFFEGKYVVFGSHDHCIYFLNYQKKLCEWSIQCNGAVLAPPNMYGNSAVFSTLAGELLLVDLPSGSISWRNQLGTPFFSSPCRVGNDRFIVCDVKGVLTAHRISDGHECDRLSTNRVVFAQPTCLLSSKCIATMSVVDDVGGVGGVGDVGDGTDDGIGDSGVVDRGVLLAVLTQSTSLFIVSYNPLCVIRQLEISGSTFVRAPVCHDVILNSSNITALQVFAGRKMTNSDYHRCASTLFVLDTNGRLLAIEILSSTRSQTVCRSSEKALKSSDIGGRVESTDETQKMNNGDEEWKTDLEIEMYEVLRVDVETFAPLTIVEEEAKEEKDCERGCDNLSESVLCKHHTRRYCAVFGARDDRLRCFRISRLNDI